GDVEPARSRARNHREAFNAVFQTTAVDVYDVQRSTRHRGGADYFADGFNAGTRFNAPRAPHMCEHRNMIFDSHAKHLDYFESRRARRVLNSHTNAESARGELLLQPF